MDIGSRIKKLRKELDLTQTEFATRIGSVQNTVTGYESGRRNPSAPVISLICREFNVREEWLRDGTGEMFKAAPSSALDALAEQYGVTSDAIAYAWLLRYPAKMQVIIGTTNPDRLKHAAKAAEVELTRSEWYQVYRAAGNQLP